MLIFHWHCILPSQAEQAALVALCLCASSHSRRVAVLTADLINMHDTPQQCGVLST
jgi:hypothetical protein